MSVATSARFCKWMRVAATDGPSSRTAFSPQAAVASVTNTLDKSAMAPAARIGDNCHPETPGRTGLPATGIKATVISNAQNRFWRNVGAMVRREISTPRPRLARRRTSSHSAASSQCPVPVPRRRPHIGDRKARGRSLNPSAKRSTFPWAFQAVPARFGFRPLGSHLSHNLVDAELPAAIASAAPCRIACDQSTVRSPCPCSARLPLCSCWPSPCPATANTATQAPSRRHKHGVFCPRPRTHLPRTARVADLNPLGKPIIRAAPTNSGTPATRPLTSVSDRPASTRWPPASQALVLRRAHQASANRVRRTPAQGRPTRPSQRIPVFPVYHPRNPSRSACPRSVSRSCRTPPRPRSLSAATPRLFRIKDAHFQPRAPCQPVMEVGVRSPIGAKGTR